MITDAALFERAWEPHRPPGIFRDIIRPGDLVLDVGANVGRMTWLYRTLGARVVAVEPQQACHADFERVFGGDPGVTLVKKAAGARPGKGRLALWGGTTISTMVPWSYWRRGRWAGTMDDGWQDVEVTTLDELIAEHGGPAFVKIDVEGAEMRVLRGLSRKAGVISFEFQPAFFHRAALACLWLLNRLGYNEFNHTLDEQIVFASKWMDIDRMAEQVKMLAGGVSEEYFGNIYARYSG